MAATGSPTDLGVVSGSAPGGAGTEPAVGSEDSPRDVRSGSRAAPEGVATKAGATKAGAPEAVASDPAAPEAGVPDDLGSGGRRRRLAVVAAVLAVLVVAGIAWFVVDRSRSDPRDRTTAGVPVGSPAAPTSATATASGAGPGGSGPGGTGDPSGGGPAGPAATATPSGAPSSPPATTPAAAGTVLPQRPAGWIDYRDRTGFALYVPQGWTRSQEGSIVYFRDRSSARVLGIDQTRRPRPNPVADWRGKADYRVARGDFPSYREIHIREVDYFRKAADWEFTFVRGGVRQHVNNRGLITADDQAYGIYWQTRNADWSRYRGDLQLIFDSFRPARRS